MEQLPVDLVIVGDIQYIGKSVTLELVKDSTTFSASLIESDDYEYHLRLAQRSMDRSHPVGVQLNRHGNIVALKRADNDYVVGLEDENNKVRVSFMGHDGIFWIHPDHPESGKMTGILRNAISNRERVWFVADRNLYIQAAGTLSEQ